MTRADALQLARNTGNVRLAAALSTPANSSPQTPPVVGVAVRIPGLRLVNTLNAWETWRGRHSREKREKATVHCHLLGHGRCSIKPPCVVTLTRIYSSRSKEMDTDGLQASFKACRDQVAAWIGADDSPRSGIEWKYEQARGKGGAENGVVISVEKA